MTAPIINHLTAFQIETTQGDSPANNGEWDVVSTERVCTLRNSISLSGTQRELIESECSTEDILDDFSGVVGLDNPTVSFSTYLEALGSTIADGISASTGLLPIHTLTRLALGGQDTSTTHTASGAHSTTTIELDSVAGLSEGSFIAVQLSNYSGGANLCHVRRITDITALVVTVDQAFPVAPVDTDLAYACVASYTDSTTLRDSSQGSLTAAFLFQLGGDGADISYQINGGVPQLSSISLERGALASLEWEVMGGSCTRPPDAPSPTWATAEIEDGGPVVIGPSTQVWLADYGSTTSDSTTLVPTQSFQVDPGIVRTPAEVMTEANAAMEGIHAFSTTYNPCTINLSILPFDSDFLADFDARTEKVCRIAKLAPPGQGIAIHFSRCTIDTDPLPEGEISNLSMQLRAHRDTDDTATTQLWRSRMTIIHY